MRKFLRPKFWSHGTNLGSLGPRSQKGLDETFSKEVSLLPSNLNKHPGVVVPLVEPKNLNQVASRCVLQWSVGHSGTVHVNPTAYIFVFSQPAEIWSPATFFQDVFAYKISALYHLYFQRYKAFSGSH